MGNTVIWKPASSAILSGYYTLKVLEAAGMPPGVINFIPGDAREISNQLLDSPELAGVHFTGSTEVFNGMWKKIGENIGRYRGYPRLVGETGGKDFIVIHPSADPVEVAVAIARGGFEYQGQKCSAASRVYAPRSLWNDIRDRNDRDDEGNQGRRRRPTSGISWERSSIRKHSPRSADTWTMRSGTRRSWPAARRRAMTGTSSSPRSLRPPIPAYRVPVRRDLRTGRNRIRLSRQRMA